MHKEILTKKLQVINILKRFKTRLHRSKWLRLGLSQFRTYKVITTSCETIMFWKRQRLMMDFNLVLHTETFFKTINVIDFKNWTRFCPPVRMDTEWWPKNNIFFCKKTILFTVYCNTFLWSSDIRDVSRSPFLFTRTVCTSSTRI